MQLCRGARTHCFMLQYLEYAHSCTQTGIIAIELATKDKKVRRYMSDRMRVYSLLSFLLSRCVSSCQGEFVACLLALLRQMSDRHYQKLLQAFSSKDNLRVRDRRIHHRSPSPLPFPSCLSALSLYLQPPPRLRTSF